MSIYKIGEVVKINDQGNKDFNGLAGVIKRIELGGDDVSILYFVEFQNDARPKIILVFLQNELNAA